MARSGGVATASPRQALVVWLHSRPPTPSLCPSKASQPDKPRAAREVTGASTTGCIGCSTSLEAVNGSKVGVKTKRLRAALDEAFLVRVLGSLS